MSREDKPRTIRVSKPLKAALVELRLLDAAPPVPELAQERVDAVERALDWKVPDDLLAAFAAQCDALRDLGVALERVVTHTTDARAAGCPAELIAIGRGDEQVFYCVKRRDADLQIHEFDGEDKQVKRRGLVEWLGELAEQRRVDLSAPTEDDDADDPDSAAELEVGKTDLETFRPTITPPPPTTGKRVRHATFGEGDVLREIGAGDGRKLEVRFAGGTKVLIARVLEEL
jgi:hypothetical protein